MALSKIDPELHAHKSWLGLVQPVGLVVSPPALSKAQVVLDRNAVPIQQALQAVVLRPASVFSDAEPVLLDFPRLACEVLGWSASDLAGAPDGPPLPDCLAVPLPEYGETLRPTYAVVDAMAGGKVLMLVLVVERGPLDKPRPELEGSRSGWPASPQARLERLLRGTGTATGLLLNGDELRLVYAPGGESSGHMGFPIAEMCTVSGRPLVAALHMLLCEHRVFSAPDKQRLLDLLEASRKYQSEVSNRLAEQVQGALWELLRGFQSADEAAHGRVLFDLPRSDPQHVYGGLLTVTMRLVFLLYAEDQGLLPDDPVYTRNYSIGGLFERLREDAGRYPDTMDQRFGAYAWLLSTFRMIFDGGSHGGLQLPARHGQLFNPDEYPFLEGRPPGALRVLSDSFEAPRVPDGVIWRMLSGLLLLDGERLSYRALDVEQVGSVYESMMGFDVRTLPGRALAVRPKSIVIDLDALLGVPANRRAAWLKEQAECDLSGSYVQALKDSKTVEDVVVALGRKVAPQTEHPLPPGALFLQPGEERRRSGSHYTPRDLTEPIVRTTLRPVLEALGPRPTPQQILAIKVCDPAMGSGAFLVESCRQLAAALLSAWEAHGSMPKLPPDEDPLLHARRLVAQCCLYGVDKNRFAVNLAKLSLWLATLARDHAFTFLDHALKHGDSLVGLTKAQIGAFHWGPPERDFGPLFQGIATSIDVVSGWRQQLQALEEGDYDQRGALWKKAEEVVHDVRVIGDLCIGAYFGADKDKDREVLRRAYLTKVNAWKQGGDRTEIEALVDDLRRSERAVLPLHWEIEFPEVFRRPNPGFDALVGNPPFAGKNTILSSNPAGFIDWLKQVHEESHGNADLVAHFFRRAFGLLRRSGTLGLIATNTIAQWDTRSSGLRWICAHGGQIYAATRRYKWPGLAAVIVSVVHIQKDCGPERKILDGREVPQITAFLFHAGSSDNPRVLKANEGKSFIGSYVLGMGFTFDDTDKSGTASSLATMRALMARDPRNQQRIFPYLGGEELNSSPTHAHHRYVINFGELTEEEARAWPDLMKIVEEKVKGTRGKHSTAPWWQFERLRGELYSAIAGLDRVLAIARVSQYMSFAFARTPVVPSEGLVVLPFAGHAPFAVVQSRVHEVWARFFGSSLEDRLRYTPSDCFETFPFPVGWETDARLEAVGKQYDDFRATLMQKREEGLTDTYNRFHDPCVYDPDIETLRTLHAELDRAVLDAYGFADVATRYEFLLEYEEEESEDEASRRRKKPFRLRWPDAVRDEVLARLLDLNQQRYQEEVVLGLHAAGKPKAPRKTTTPAKSKPAGTLTLFPSKKEDG